MTENKCDVYDFSTIREVVLERKGKWTVEDEVRLDMLENGYSPHNKEDIEEYWNDLLEDWKNEK
tara:strand:- start:11955 stop:12146 length:192 start_codon:yes stop_codon:yes gene_type:complete